MSRTSGRFPHPKVLYYSAQHLPADGAVMITGSHNPPEYNGFKTVCGSGTLHGAAIQEVRQIIEAQDYERGEGHESSADLVTPYVEEVASQFKFDRRVKLAVDAGNGTAGPVFHRILEKINVEAAELYFEMDGSFPNHHPDPTVPANLQDLIGVVKDTHAELGIAFDGDSDRIGAVDDRGEVIYGDMLMLIFGREILTRKPGSTFIGEVKCSQLMYDELNRLGGRAIPCSRPATLLIKAKMKEEHALRWLGEMSGHMFFADRYYGYDDALYSACRLIEIVVSDSGQPLSAQLASFPKLVSTPEIRVDTTEDVKFELVARRVAAQLKGQA